MVAQSLSVMDRRIQRAWSMADEAHRKKQDLFIHRNGGLILEAREHADKVLGWDKSQLMNDDEVVEFYLQ